METSSQDSVPNYMRNGLGVGLAVQTPELQRDSGLRVLPLSGFPSLPVEVFWRGRFGEIAQVFVDGLVERAKRLFAKPGEDKVDFRRVDGQGSYLSGSGLSMLWHPLSQIQ